nr:hydroxyacid dehydrogenase [Aquibacillus albus]
MKQDVFDLVYPAEVRQGIEEKAEVYAPPLTTDDVLKNPSILKDVEVIFSGWGAPKLDKAFLDAAPNLKALFYAAGSIKQVATDESWDRNIIITNAADANAIPVAEFTISQILFCLKNGWQFVRGIQQAKSFPPKPFDIVGGYGSTVGIISLSMVGRHVIRLLKAYDMKVLTYDPFVTEEDANQLGVTLCSLEDIFKQSDLVSLHTPLLKETVGMITGEHFDLMKQNASFINTARGAIVREQEMVDVLKRRDDITAVLDVTDPEPPEKDSPLYTLSNVVLTPHLAGSEGTECGRMGAYMLAEYERFLKSEPLQWQVTREQFKVMA